MGGIALESDGAPLEGGPRRRRLALLALVAAAGRRGINRDRVIAILWPDSPSAEARHALSQTLYALRRDLDGKEAIVLGAELKLDPAVIGSDLDDFEAALAARDWTTAASLYRGPFLDGFYLPDVPEFERWIDDERRDRASQARTAFEGAATEATAANRHGDAVDHWRRAVALDPLATRAALGLMEALARTGDRAGAVAHAREHAELVRRELEIEPDPAIAAAVERYRADLPKPAPGPKPAAAAAVDRSLQTPESARPEPAAAAAVVTRPAWRRPAVIGVVVALIAVAVTAALRPWARTRSAPGATPILAVGDLRDLTSPDSTSIGNVLGEVLATSLSRLTRLEVIASSRMLELMPRGDLPVRAARLEAARRAGAAEILEGELVEAGGSLRLDLRRVDVATGVVRRGYLATASDRWAVVDSITNAIAADLALHAPVEPIEAHSPIALRLYEDGLRSLYQYDTYAAARSFSAAVAEDSTFAMAAYYGWWSAALVGDPSAAALRALALRLASRAPTRERLLIRTHVGGEVSDPISVFAAESLAAAFPRDPEALTRAAQILQASGAPLQRTVDLLDRAIAIDSAASGGRSGPCRLCESLGSLMSAYDHVDSIPAVLATADRWTALLPTSPQPLMTSWAYLLRLNRFDQARRALDRFTALSRQPNDSIEVALIEAIYREDVAAMESGCRAAFDLGLPVARFTRHRWLCVIALRTLGRFRAGVSLASEGRSPSGDARRVGVPADPVLLAVLDFEQQRVLLAADFFNRQARTLIDSLGNDPAGGRPIAWNLTLAATAVVASQDTVQGNRLADSIEQYGARSSFARDPRLHHFVRGLLFAVSKRHGEAVEHFQSAVSSWPLGYTRINYELAGSLLALDRPGEAIRPLQAALRGGLEGPQLYLNRTEIHERLGEAFDRLGQTDSAAVHFGRVARLWKNADPILRTRVDRARDWLTRHGRPLP